MKRNNMSHWLNTLIVLLAVAFSISAWAMGGAKQSSTNTVAAKSSANYYWYDGKRKRVITQDSEMVAELISSGASSVLKSKISAAREVGKQTSATVKLWDVSAAGDSNQSLSALASTMKGSVSPVFSNSQSGGQRMALPGGILVTFKAHWDENKVNQWVSKKGLTVKQKMGFGNIYVLNSAAGLASLNLANSIYESGEVEGASPNWWQDLKPF